MKRAFLQKPARQQGRKTKSFLTAEHAEKKQDSHEKTQKTQRKAGLIDLILCPLCIFVASIGGLPLGRAKGLPFQKIASTNEGRFNTLRGES